MHINRLLYCAYLFLIIVSCTKTDPPPVVNNPMPSFSSISPSSIAAGSASFTLTINGANFVSGSIIKWNGIALTTTYVNATQLTALVPSNTIIAAGSAAVTVFSPAPGGGTSSACTFTITAPVAPVPTLTSLSPNTITAGASDFNLIAQGTNFTNGVTLQWNGSALATTFISASQLLAVVPAAKVTNVGTATITVLSSSPASTSNALTFTINAVTPSVKKVLFDASHGETSGNADWVIDADNGTPQRFPTPLQSTISASTPETYWTGGISSFGIALVKHGYAVETLPKGIAISYGNSSNVQDLSNYDVFVVDEPNKVFTAAEKLAILDFVNAGGGLFMVADHTISDRDNDGWDSPLIWNDLMTNNTQKVNPFGFSIDLKTYSGTSSNVLTNGSSPVLSGSQGAVTKLDLAGGTTATLNPTVNANVKGLIWYSNSTQNTSNVICLTSTYGTGRVFFVGDSSPLDDGTGAPGESLFVDWPTFSHQSLFMNATLWLAKEQ